MRTLFSMLVILVLYNKVQGQFFTSEEDLNRQKNSSLPDSICNDINIPSLYPGVFHPRSKGEYFGKHSWLRRKLFEESFAYACSDTNECISIDPVIDLRYGIESGQHLYRNTRGFIVQGRFNHKLFIRSEFFETQTTLPEYEATWADTMKFIPGMIRMKPFGNNGFDYGVVFSQMIWHPIKHYTLRLGYDRFHIGKGYRSIFLSDASQAFPFLMNSVKSGKWSLSHQMASLRNPDFNHRLQIPVSESGVYQQKWLSFNYLTFQPTKWLNLGLFEAVVFLPPDSNGSSFYPMSLLPLPVIRTAFIDARAKHHALIGIQADATLLHKIEFYTQMIADDISFSPSPQQQIFQGALQLGVKWVFTEHGYVFSEWNMASNNAYTSLNHNTTFTHNDQPLAHPLGQQFKEWIFGSHFIDGQWVVDLKFNTIWGSSLALNDTYLGTDSYLGNGFYAPKTEPDRLWHLQMTLGFIINPSTNLMVFAGFHYRNFLNSYSDIPDNTMVYEFGVRHRLRKQYNDFY